MNDFLFLDEYYLAKTSDLKLSHGEDFVILTCVLLMQNQRVTDRQLSLIHI